ncbi:Fic/DOC family protein [Corynebacterium aquatimens]|uniref:protein adenylyltransferase n=1 Tax=Corynebacterium aquatimens TaxID=1190508 RepID=A0A931GWR6_9CORY|nr:Fic family protein [Corynebacterium aquatimens]MBG6123001.1 cell filamentation protein [Corynebacterium aquatimens]WJY66665.1 putative adenosine monophosphate-protein transferase fic [Corynebacterium aquatimens]
MPRKQDAAPENFFGIEDARDLELIAGELSGRRLFELESGPPLREFTRESLIEVHRHLLQDVYPWAGQIRSTEVGAMGLMMCRAEFVEDELGRVMRRIQKQPPSTADLNMADATIADHWCELTIVHPFRDGNSRTQRYFFDQMFRAAGWVVDWTQVNASHAHAARYVGAATADASFLAQLLLPAVYPVDALPPTGEGSLRKTQGHRDSNSAEIFQHMMQFRRDHPAAPWEPPTST